MDTQQMVNALRRRKELADEAAAARTQADAFVGAFPRPQFTTQTQPVSGSIGGVSFQTPGETTINYGDIIGKGLSNYLGARANKKEREVKSELESLNQDFMNSTLENDPQAMKLYSLAQAGLPGADKALAQHLAPKKQALAGFTQAATSGMASPELLAEISTQYGIDPEIAKRAGEYAVQQKIKEEERKSQGKRQDEMFKFGLRAQLKGMPSGGSMSGSKAGKEITTAGGGVYEIDGVPTEPIKLTAGERQQRAKMMNNMDDIIMKGEQQIAKFPDVWAAASKPGGLGRGQQVAQALADSNIPLVSGIGAAARSKDAALLHDYANSEVLSRMGQLGGNDSNEELRRMQASVPNAMQSPETMRALLKRFDAWQKKTMGIIKQKRSDVQTGKYFDPRAGFNDPRNAAGPALEENYNPQQSGSPAVSPDMLPKKRKSFDEIMKEVAP